MSDVTVYLNNKTMDNLVTKIENRLADARLDLNPHKGKSRDEIKLIVWNRIAVDVSKYLKQSSGKHDGIENYAFLFGEVLDDTVFMLTPIASGAGPLESYTFQPDQPLQYHYKFAVDFYESI